MQSKTTTYETLPLGERVYFSLKLWEQCLRRCWSALLWSGKLVACHYSVRRKLATIQGWSWVQSQMPQVSFDSLVNTAISTLKIAWKPPFERAAIERTNRIRIVVAQLESLERRIYPISNRSSERVYFAALSRCIEAICKTPVSRESLSSLHVSTLMESTGIADYLLRWIGQKLANQPKLWSEPNLQGSSLFNSASPFNPATDLERAAIESSRVRQARRDYLHAQVAMVSWVSERQLAHTMIENELKILALPTAILEACRKRVS